MRNVIAAVLMLASLNAMGAHTYVETISREERDAIVRRAGEGDPRAQVSLGWMYYRGKGVPHSYEEAVMWFRTAAEQGDAKGQYTLGHMYALGKGVPINERGEKKDLREAAKWFRKAAEQGLAIAEFRLGGLYDSGHVMLQNYVEAYKWRRRAARQGHFYAHIYLSDVYREGRGVPKDDTLAYVWAIIASATANDSHERMLAREAMELSQHYYRNKRSFETQRIAQQMARDCVDSDYTLCSW